MSSLLSSLRVELNRYYNLREDLGIVVNYLSSSIEKIEPASSKISYYYNIDEAPADHNIVSNKRNELITKKSELTNNVLPAIDNQITIIKQQIRAEEARIEAERQRVAEEAAKMKASS
ncbi:MAG: hypothetical protein ACM3O4_05945 [Ignavibacteriales bacterium]